MSILSSIVRSALSILTEVPSLGLTKHTPDERDFSYDDVILGKQAYTPKYQKHEIQTVSVKNQQPFNTCCFASAVAQKEVDEGVELSVKGVVAAAKMKGRLQKDGYSTLRNAQQTLVDFGAPETTVLDDSRADFTSYSSPKVLSKAVVDSAAMHRSAKFFAVNTPDAWYKALDEGKVIQTWMEWRTGYNMSGGLRAPFVLNIGSGVSVGGHAFVCIGYNLTRGVMIFQNSFGKFYGDNGKFYVTISDWFNRVKSVGYVSLDVDNGSIIASYEGKDVKSDGDPRLWRIEKGKKRLYPNETVFYSHGGRFGSDKTWVLISGSLLRSIPEGAIMKQK